MKSILKTLSVYSIAVVAVVAVALIRYSQVSGQGKNENILYEWMK